MKTSWLILGLWLSIACTSLPVLKPLQVDPGQDQAKKEAGTQVETAAPLEEKEEERTVLLHIFYYLSSRVLDLFDIARLGVSSGPGIGIDVTLTRYCNLAAMTKKSVGLGFQTFRHLPVEWGPVDSLNMGYLKIEDEPSGGPWYRSPGDIRLEIHFIQIGAHAAVEVIEIVDLLLGFFCIDIVDDDL